MVVASVEGVEMTREGGTPGEVGELLLTDTLHVVGEVAGEN